MERIAKGWHQDELRCQVLIILEKHVELVGQTKFKEGLEVHRLDAPILALHQRIAAGYLIRRPQTQRIQRVV